MTIKKHIKFNHMHIIIMCLYYISEHNLRALLINRTVRKATEYEHKEYERVRSSLGAIGDIFHTEPIR